MTLCFPVRQNENAWIWIDGILDLIKKHLVDLWRDGYDFTLTSKLRLATFLKVVLQSYTDDVLMWKGVAFPVCDFQIHHGVREQGEDTPPAAGKKGRYFSDPVQ